jgi:hypothetical protein
VRIMDELDPLGQPRSRDGHSSGQVVSIANVASSHALPINMGSGLAVPPPISAAGYDLGQRDQVTSRDSVLRAGDISQLTLFVRAAEGRHGNPLTPAPLGRAQTLRSEDEDRSSNFMIEVLSGQDA